MVVDSATKSELRHNGMPAHRSGILIVLFCYFGMLFLLVVFIPDVVAPPQSFVTVIDLADSVEDKLLTNIIRTVSCGN